MPIGDVLNNGIDGYNRLRRALPKLAQILTVPRLSNKAQMKGLLNASYKQQAVMKPQLHQ